MLYTVLDLSESESEDDSEDESDSEDEDESDEARDSSGPTSGRESESTAEDTGVVSAPIDPNISTFTPKGTKEKTHGALPGPGGLLRPVPHLIEAGK